MKRMLERLEHCKKADAPIEVTPPGTVMLVRLVQLRKQLSGMAVMPLPKVTSFMLSQFSKAKEPNSVILSGMMMLVRLLQSAKA